MQGLLSFKRWALPTSDPPPAVSHIHGSAAGAFPGVVTTNLSHGTGDSVTDRKGSMTGMVMQMGGATKDEILDAFDGEIAKSCSLQVKHMIMHFSKDGHSSLAHVCLRRNVCAGLNDNAASPAILSCHVGSCA